jgi:hypothetical protein
MPAMSSTTSVLDGIGVWASLGQKKGWVANGAVMNSAKELVGV